MNDILSKILINKANELKILEKDLTPIRKQNCYDFYKILNKNKISVIAEVKFKSPSEGLIYKNIDPLKVALEYLDAGADAISIISDSKFFDGDVKFIQEIREHINIPILQKDFIIEKSQIIEGHNCGADAFLLIADVLNDKKINEFQELAKNLNMSILLEMHDIKNIDRLKKIKPDIVGVNCRDLKTMRTDLTIFKNLSNLLPYDSIKVAESGIKTSDDIKYVRDLGYNAVLVGTSLMKSGSPGKSLESLISNL